MRLPYRYIYIFLFLTFLLHFSLLLTVVFFFFVIFKVVCWLASPPQYFPLLCPLSLCLAPFHSIFPSHRPLLGFPRSICLLKWKFVKLHVFRLADARFLQCSSLCSHRSIKFCTLVFCFLLFRKVLLCVLCLTDTWFVQCSFLGSSTFCTLVFCPCAIQSSFYVSFLFFF